MFALAFMGFSVLFYQSALTFKQDRIALAAMMAPGPQSAPQGSDALRALAGSERPPLQGPAAVGLAFRINSGPDLRATIARLGQNGAYQTAIAVDSRPLPEIIQTRALRGVSGGRGNIR